MDKAHWMLLGWTAVFASLLLLFTVSTSPQSRLRRWVRRLFWSAALLTLSGEIGGVGLNAFNLAAVTGLGLPGYVTITALAFL